MNSLPFMSAISADILFSTVFSTYYHPEGQWSAAYSIFTSGIDLIFLALLRSLVFLAIASGDSTYGKNSWVFWLVTIFSYVFTLTKVLCLAEDMTLLSGMGVILSIVWSLTATAIMGYLIYKSAISRNDNVQEKNEEEIEKVSDDDDHVTTSEQIMFVLSYCKEQWIWYLAGFALMFVSVPAEILEPSAQGNVIDTAVGRKGYYALLIAIFHQFGVGLLARIFGELSRACMQRATSFVGRRMKLDLFTSLVNKDISFFDAHPSGDLISRISYDCDLVSGAVSDNLTSFIQTVVLLFSSLGFVLFYSWRMTVLALITSPLTFVIFNFYGNFFMELWESERSQTVKLTQIVSDVLSTMKTVRSFACERREIRRFSDSLDKTMLCQMKSSLWYAGFSWTCHVAQSLTAAILLLYGGHLVLSDKMSSGVLVTFLLYLRELENHVQSLVSTVTEVMSCASATKQVMIYMKNTSEHQMKGVEKPQITGEIEMAFVNFAYPSRSTVEVLKNIDIKIESGKTTAFVGASGGGKSTLASLIQQFYTPSSGSITIDKVPIQNVEHEYYHEKVSIVAQEPVLYDCSIRENILYGCDWATEEDLMMAARMANVHDFVMQLDDGYETSCGERGAQLSGGQKQRIAIARALVRKPAVLILDEATSALDAHSESEVQQALERVAGTLTIIVIAHRLSTIKHADRIYVVDNGTIVQSGTHLELLMDTDGPYYSLVAKQRTNM